MKTTKMLADKYNKRHSGILRKVRAIIKRDLTFEEGVTIVFEILEYQDKDGINRKKQINRVSHYILSDDLYNILDNNLKYGGHLGASLELEYITFLKKVFPLLNFQTQYSVCGGKYRLDAYSEEVGLILEVDEDHHKYQLESDKIREVEVLNYFREVLVRNKSIEGQLLDLPPNHWNTFIRIKEGGLHEAIRDINNYLYETQDCFGLYKLEGEQQWS